MNYTLLFTLLFAFSAHAVSNTVADRQYTIDERDEFQTRLQKEIAFARRDIEELRQNLKMKSAKARAELESDIRKLDEKRLELSARADRLNSASKSAWNELRSGAQAAYKELSSSVTKASKEISRAQ